MTPSDEEAYAGGVAWSRHLCAVSHAHKAVPRDLAAGSSHLLAMGDSWFNYFPPFDALVALQRKYGHVVHSVASAGVHLAALAPPAVAAATGITNGKDGKTLTNGNAEVPQLVALLRIAQGLGHADKQAVKALLISGGGNDVVDAKVFKTLLNDAGKGLPAINEEAFHDFVEVELRGVLLQVLGAATELCRRALGRTVPILIHGYARPVPDGRTLVPAGSLRTLLAQAGYTRLDEATTIMGRMIDRLNEMQMQLLAAASKELQHVRHVDLRETLCGDSTGGWRVDWQNEMHPTIPRGFTKVADRLQLELMNLGAKALANAGAHGASG